MFDKDNQLEAVVLESGCDTHLVQTFSLTLSQLTTQTRSLHYDVFYTNCRVPAVVTNSAVGLPFSTSITGTIYEIFYLGI